MEITTADRFIPDCCLGRDYLIMLFLEIGHILHKHKFSSSDCGLKIRQIDRFL